MMGNTMVGSDQEQADPMENHAVPDEALGHSGFQAAGTFTKARKHLQTAAAAEQMQAIDRQMQALLEKMQRHNQLIGTQHLAIENADKVHFFHKSTKAPRSPATMQTSLEWPSKIDFSLFEKSGVKHAVSFGEDKLQPANRTLEPMKPRTPGHVDNATEGDRISAHTVASIGGPVWGATEGGRDKLGWIRQLVKYTETHPIYIADSASSAVEVLEDGSIQKTVFPSLKPNRREDALLLQQWLADMMAQLTANAPQTPSDQAQVEMADAALWLYGIAFEELQRHIGVECRERAQVLACLWGHCCRLTELRCAVQYEALLAHSRQGFEGLADQRLYLKGQMSDLRQQLEEVAEQRSADAQQAQRESEISKRQLANAQQQLQFKADIIHQLTGGLQAESEQKENFAAALTASRKALDESRQERGSLRYEVDAKNRKAEALATELHLTETSLSERQAEVALLKGHERDYLLKIATLEENYVKLKRDAEANEVLLLAVREQLAVRSGELAQCQLELAEQKGRCSSMEISMNTEVASRDRTERELKTAYLQRDAIQGQLDRMAEMRRVEGEAFGRDLQEAADSKQQLADQLSDARAEATSWQHQLVEAKEVQDSLKERIRHERTQKQAVEQELEDFGTKLNTVATVLDDTGLTLLDLKTAKMVSGTEEGLTVRKFLIAAPPGKILDLTKLQLKKMHGRVPELERSTAVAVEKMRLEETARRKLEERLISTKTALSRMSRERETVGAQLTQAEQIKLVAEGELAELQKSSEERVGQIEALSQDLKATQKEVGRLRPLEQRVRDLISDIKQQQSAKDRLEDAIAAKQDDIARLQAKQAMSEKALDLGAAQVADLKEALQEQGDSLESSEAARNALKAEKAKLEGDLAVLQVKLDNREVQYQDAVRQLNISKFMLSESDEARTEVQKLTEEVAQLKTKLAARAQEVENLNWQLAQTGTQLQQAIEAKVEHEEQAAQLQAQVSVKERFITTLRRTITTGGADTNSPLSGLGPSRYGSSERQPSLSPRNSSGLVSQRSSLSSLRSSEGPSALTRRRSVVFSSARRGSFVEGQLAGAEGQPADTGVDFSNAALEAGLAESNSSVQQLQGQCTGLQAQLNTLEGAHAADVEAMTLQLAEAAGALAAKEGVIRKLQARLEQTATASGMCPRPSNVHELEAELADKKQELKSVQSNLGESEKRLKALRETVQQKGPALPFVVPADTSAQEAAQAMDALKAVHRQQTMWLRTKAALLANFSKKVKQELAQSRSHAAELKVAIVQQQVAGLQDLLQQQQDFAGTLEQVCQAGPEVLIGLQQEAAEVRSQMSALKEEAGTLAGQVEPAVAALLAANPPYQPPPHTDKGTQAFKADEQEWLDFANGLTKGRPRSPMSRQEVVSSIVSCYCARVQRLQAAGMQDVLARDSIFDAVADATTASVAVQVAELMTETGPVGMLLTSARMFQNDVKVLTFCRLAGMVDGHIPPSGWRFFLQMLHCIKALQEDAWQTLVQEWQSSNGTVVPIQCVIDVVGNAFNSNDPAGLPVSQSQLMPLIQDSKKGPAIDLDAFLLVMLEEHLQGRCPANALLLPRRITDGSLANAYNLKHELESSTAPSPPGSASSRSRPSSGRLDSRASMRPMLDRQATLSGRSRPTSASKTAALAGQPGDSTTADDPLLLPPLGPSRSTDIFASLSSLVANNPPRPGSPLTRNSSRGAHLAGPTTSTLPRID